MSVTLKQPNPKNTYVTNAKRNSYHYDDHHCTTWFVECNHKYHYTNESIIYKYIIIIHSYITHSIFITYSLLY